MFKIYLFFVLATIIDVMINKTTTHFMIRNIQVCNCLNLQKLKQNIRAYYDVIIECCYFTQKFKEICIKTRARRKKEKFSDKYSFYACFALILARFPVTAWKPYLMVATEHLD